MRSAALELAMALERPSPGILVVYYDHDRDGMVTELRSLLPAGARATRAKSVDTARRSRDRFVFLVPENEATAVRDLDGNRERFLEPPRQAPVVLLLIRGGSGQQELANAPGLASWVRGLEVDPTAISTIDVEQERNGFLNDAGDSPEAWLKRWHNGEIQASSDNTARAYRAALLERRP